MAEIDLIKIKEIGLRLAQSVTLYKERDFLNQLHLNKEPRIKVLVGFRGLGKTTALLQRIGEKGIYFSLDHPYILEHSLYNVGKMLLMAGHTTLLIDEVHHYKDWKQDSKALYDEFPHVSFVLSGSAPLAFEPERRYQIISVNPLSFQEFMKIQGKEVAASQEVWRQIDVTLPFIAAQNDIYEYFQHYMSGGGFPMYLTYHSKTLDAIYNSIRKSIREDAPFFAKVSGEEIMFLEKILITLATSSPGELSIHSLSGNLGMKKHQAYSLISLLEKMKIVRLIRPYGKGPKAVRGDPKLLFFHPNLRSVICATLQVTPDKGALREELAVFSLLGRGWVVNTIKGQKKTPDYIISQAKEKIVIEIGGSSKKRVQLQEFPGNSLLLDERQLMVLAMF